MRDFVGVGNATIYSNKAYEGLVDFYFVCLFARRNKGNLKDKTHQNLNLQRHEFEFAKTQNYINGIENVFASCYASYNRKQNELCKVSSC